MFIACCTRYDLLGAPAPVVAAGAAGCWLFLGRLISVTIRGFRAAANCTPAAAAGPQNPPTAARRRAPPSWWRFHDSSRLGLGARGAGWPFPGLQWSAGSLTGRAL